MMMSNTHTSVHFIMTTSYLMNSETLGRITIRDDFPTHDCDTEPSGNALDCEVSMGDYFTNTDLMMYFNKV